MSREGPFGEEEHEQGQRILKISFFKSPRRGLFQKQKNGLKRKECLLVKNTNEGGELVVV
jgi:hypothetical protein